MTMENDARCSGGGGGGGDGSEAGESIATVPELDLDDDEDSSSQDQHNNNNNTLATSHAATSHALTPSSREMRNRAEKQRRDKLNTHIGELATLNPLIANNDKKMDKTSILRLSAAYLRLYKTIVHNPSGADELSCCTPTPAAAGAAPSGTLAILPPSTTPALTPKTEGGNAITSNGENTQICTVLQERSVSQFHDEYNLPCNVTEQMLENMDGFLLILTSTGKVVYVSSTIGKLLGHSQNDLMGQSLFNITCPSDHDELRKNLQPNMNDDEPGPSNAETRRHRRSFFLKLSQRATSRGENIQYELVHVLGHLRVPGGHESTTPSTQLARKNTRSREGNQNQSQNQHETVLVAVGKLSAVYRRDLSILDASKDEYVTRHALDGNMVYVDHRISVVAGYMPEEVSGLSAFSYMHEEDVGWTIVSLRQMYSSGGGYGSSTYRLLTKTGQFIYLRTHGHLEYDEVGEKPISFICVNTLLSEEEGEQGVQDMKVRFSANTNMREALMAADISTMFKMPIMGEAMKGSTMDSEQLDNLITTHLSEIPSSPASDEPLQDSQYIKCTLISRTLPPPSTQILATRRRESSAAGSPGSHDQHPNSPTLVRTCIRSTTTTSEHPQNRNTRHTSPNGSIKSMSPHSIQDPQSPLNNYCSSSPISIKPESSPYSQHSNSPPPISSLQQQQRHTADPMITGTGTCTTIIHSRSRRDSYHSSTTNLVLETAVYDHVTSSTEIRRTTTTTTTTSRRGRPPRNGGSNNKRSLSSDPTTLDTGSSNNKRLCTDVEIFETDDKNKNNFEDLNNKKSQQQQQQQHVVIENWEDENNADSPASQNSLLSNNTDFSSIELDETGDPNTDFTDLIPSFGDVMIEMLRGDGERSSPSQRRPSPTTKPANITGDTLEENPVHRLKTSKLGSQTDIAGV